jgi:hypothetical protein
MAQPPSGGEWFDDSLAGIAAYYLTSLPVLLGILFGAEMPRSAASGAEPPADLISACLHFDARHYVRIIQEGYSYDPDRRSPVAFFPAYPLLSRGLGQVFGLAPAEAAMLTTHLALLGAFVLLARYVRCRWPEATAAQRGLVLAIFGLWPLGMFFRMPYAESLFLSVTLALLYGMARGWPLVVLALLAGLGTGVRPVGVALTAAFLWYVLAQPGPGRWAKAGRVLLGGPLACWGLLAYMGYQWLAFDTPWAFAQTQEHWSLLAPLDRSWPVKLRSLAMLEPIWGVYVPDSGRYWAKAETTGSPLFGLYFWNPILFVLAVVLLALGGWKRWLTSSELVLGASLLAIPYLTRSYEMSMAAHGRFAAVVIVNYLVIGRMMAQAPPLAVAVLCSVLSLLLFICTFLYVSNYSVF